MNIILYDILWKRVQHESIITQILLWICLTLSCFMLFICGLLIDTRSMKTKHKWVVGWTMNWKTFERKHLWPNWNTILAFAFGLKKKKHGKSVMMPSVVAGILTKCKYSTLTVWDTSKVVRQITKVINVCETSNEICTQYNSYGVFAPRASIVWKLRKILLGIEYLIQSCLHI